jgi:hypothetical protein
MAFSKLSEHQTTSGKAFLTKGYKNVRRIKKASQVLERPIFIS